MTEAAGTEVWQARIGTDFAAQLKKDAVVLGLEGRTDIVKAGLQLLHRQSAEMRMARTVEEFYGPDTPPLPIGVLPDDVQVDVVAPPRGRARARQRTP